MGCTSSYCKQTLVALLVYILALTPTLVFANTAEKWVVEKVVYESVAKVIDVTAKRATATASNDPFYKARVPVTASATGSTVASMIRMGIAGVAIYGLIQGVGWIIENGVVKKPVSGSINNEQAGYFTGTGYYKTLDLACKSYFNDRLKNGYTYAVFQHNGACVLLNPDGREVEGTNFKWQQNPNYIPTTDYKPVTDTELGDEVNNSPQAPQILPDVYNPNNPAGGQAPQSTSDALDNANPQTETDPTGSTKPKPNVDTDGDGKPDVYDPEKPSIGEDFTLPEFCSWAVTVCEWYKKYKEDSKQAEAQRESEKVAWQREEEARQKEESQREKERNFWQKVEDWFKKWDDTPQQNDDTEVDVDQPENQNIDTTINFGGACPQPISVPYSFAGATGTIEFSYEPLCQIASFIKPVVITVASFSAALIIGGIRTEDN
ncbi:virulence factor TspB C-terminal domain-related protein [Acinetobacter bereziniae]|uniref:virulence factor TspB C-terminal domain-related protein n=1 Tax=Acinetobacter bereziniae TaxID=106648 RepID=UPI0012502C02|nr:virulence factor TspB C-terminal domain-related protein [Acinetobacter bereziniae]